MKMLVTFGRRVGFIVVVFIFHNSLSVRLHGSPGKTLYVADEKDSNKLMVINRVEEDPSLDVERSKRDVSDSSPTVHKNISTWTTHLNDSHQQLMVHWVGEGSNVIICLARDATPRNKGSLSPSALFISYDYGKNFTNKTESFKLGDAPNSGYAQLDKFFNHPKYPEFCVFVDSANKKLFYTKDNGKTIIRSDLNFHPSELAYDEDFPEKYVILDKVDTNRTLYLTLDGGKTFKAILTFVKTFYWSSGPGFPKVFYVERWKLDGTSAVLSASDPANIGSAIVLFKDAKDFQIKGDYMFATKQSKEKNSVDLFISHQRGPFYKAEFQTELNLRKFHIADVTDKRVFISVMHTDTLANLYVSEINKNFTQYNFVLSLEQVLCYFPEGNWKDSWLEDVTEDPFTDLYRVEGLKGIYIASRVDSKAPAANIGPEHVISLITFDHGATWSPINPPTEDENGKPLSCQLENSCSLHLCQKFSQLYPVTRSASIMSSKSAPGIIMATGVMGKSLKGIPGVYLSRDAGVTWKRILKDYYFFNYGDHGGVLVAVKYFKSRGETRKILYSTNEGIEWNSYKFNADDLRIYGLMTEPGENTTTFTMFGSANEQHQWIIITVDLFNAFSRNCTAEDYKFWSPSPQNSPVPCILGTRESFQRRLAHTNCYNGINYDRPTKKEICHCVRRDYECDYGFKIQDNSCVRNRSVKFDPYAIPSECRPGHYYKHTKGYRKIDGDQCQTPYFYNAYEPDMIPCPLDEPIEFILVALRDRIASIDLSNYSILFPVTNQNNIVAIEFDMKNNCIYWADIELDKISRQCYNNGSTQEVVVESDLASIEGMALDWISNVLFFVDGMRKKIEAVRTDLLNEGRMRVTILDNKVLSKPRGIAVHPKAGYLFWTDWDRNNPSVSRSNLDGTNVKKLFGKPIVQWPNGITIDRMSERIYWVDAMEDYIASSDMEGNYFRRIIWNDEKVSHPFAVAVLKDRMFWDDWKAKSIFIADKDTGANVITINDSFSGLMDLKVFAHFVQVGNNACSYKNTSCDTLCLGTPDAKNPFSCLCPDGFKRVNGKCMCSNDMEPYPNMTCPTKAGSTCGPDMFTCKNGLCIEKAWRCDGNNDCGDTSDEQGCTVCTPPMLSCDGDTRCYLPIWRCDGEPDCADMTDEKDCGNCTATQFHCDNGQCIDSKWKCDGDNDCRDGSDEKNCGITPKRADTVNCRNGFACGNDTSALCIPNSWVCDGENDCPGGEDENEDKCHNSTCAPYMFRCPNGKCIYKNWVCDGENDCGDDKMSDEENCTTSGHSKLIPRPSTNKPFDLPTNSTCLDWMFKCNNGHCLPYWWRCDSIDDCGDNSDEVGCGEFLPPTTTVKPEHTGRRCSKNQFMCSPGVCIPLSWVCDSMDDCADGADERGCSRRTGITEVCAPNETPCMDGKGCVSDDKLCDKHYDCADRSDESHCFDSPKTKIDCPNDYFLCDDGTLCVSQIMVCNGHPECLDQSDEVNCSSTIDPSKSYRSLSIGVDQLTLNSTSFLVSCWMAQQQHVIYSYLPSIAKVSDGVWRNMTWTQQSSYRFTGLEPYTNYNVTFYIRDSRSNRTIPSNKYITATTGEGVPSPPRRLTVRQLVGRELYIVWDRPEKPNGVIRHYNLYYTPPVPPMEKFVPEHAGSWSPSATIDGFFQPNVNYSFWVTASNNIHTSESSEVAIITFDELGDVDDIHNVSVKRNGTSLFLMWNKIPGVEGYRVLVRPPQSRYAFIGPFNTTATNITLNDIPSGTQLYIEVSAYKAGTVGQPFTIPIITNGQPDEALNLTAILLKDTGTTVKLEWSPPLADKYKGKDLKYVVRYNKANRMKLFGTDNDTKIETKHTSLLVQNLHACEAYVFTVSLPGGVFSKKIDIITRENPRAPVKNLNFLMNEKNSTLHIVWNSNCDVVREPVSYMLKITEETKNQVSRIAMKPTKNTTIEHVFYDVTPGSRFHVCVSVNVPNATQTCGRVRSSAIPQPTNLVAWQSPNGHVMVSWHDPQPAKHKYQIIISSKEIPENLTEPIEGMQTAVAEFSPKLMEVSRGSGPLYVSVRAMSDDGYYSDISEVQTLAMDGAEPEQAQTSMAAIWWGGVSACLAAIVLAAALVHLAMKHRRLTRSFLRFTSHTPRYDSRRGQATITDHGMNDDDVPPIQGFSDDEPLVIA